MDWETIYEELKVIYWFVLLIFSSTSYFLLSPATTLGIILGGMLIIANFHIFQYTFSKAFDNKEKLKGRRISIYLNYYFRLFALGVIIFMLLRNGHINPVGLVIGLSTVVIAIAFLGVSMALKTKGGEAL
ncbi:ATP synthase subunit I [Thermodesulfobacteriota bacterium]